MESISLSLHQQGCLKNLHGEEVIRQMENEPKKASVRFNVGDCTDSEQMPRISRWF